MRASRLLSILMLLQTNGRLSAELLAGRLEVSVRTIYRDVDQLSAAGVPIYAERGRSGGFALLEGWRTRLTGLTAAEAQALFLAGLPGPAAELGLGEAMAQAQLKLLATLPAGWQDDARRVAARFHLDPVDWFRSAVPAGFLQQVAEAVWDERVLWMRYERWSGTVEREVEPLGLVLKAGNWYLAAGASGQPRTYRLSGIRDVALRDRHFHRPAGFDLASWWQAATRRFEAGVWQGNAVVRLSPEGRARLSVLGRAVADAAEASAGPPDACGWTRHVIPIESIEVATRDMLRLGSDAEVLDPPALRARLHDVIRNLAAMYGTALEQGLAPAGPRARGRGQSTNQQSRCRRGSVL